ncbi:MAG: hypothetical protein WAL63_08300 [Solirubrobacteraceae bacterium]
MADDGDALAFLGVPPDRRLLEEDVGGLPDVGPRPGAAIATAQHDRLVAAGSVMTAASLVGGAALLIYGGLALLFGGAGLVALVIAVIGAALIATHWGWVHVAEYVGVSIDERRRGANDERRAAWLATIAPYPRFAVSTRVLDDASTVIERVLYRPVRTKADTFVFDRRREAGVTHDASTPAHVIAAEVETMRRDARRDTDRQRELWEAASTAYDAMRNSADDDRQHLAAQRAAATALSEHINASLQEPPLIE